MVKALRFKGDKKVKKRKRPTAAVGGPDDSADEGPSKKALTTTTTPTPTPTDDAGDGWVDSEDLDDITGPIILCFPATPPITLACDASGTVFPSPLAVTDLSTAEPTEIQQVWVATRIHGSTGKWSFKGHHGRYLSCDAHGTLSATREAISAEEEFVPVRNELGAGRWALMTVREKFISVDERGGVKVRGDAESVGFGETWTVRLQKRNKKRSKAAEGARVKDKVTRKELEDMAGVPLDEAQVKALKKARREGRFHEALLDIRVKHGKHDKFAY